LSSGVLAPFTESGRRDLPERGALVIWLVFGTI
jgi:hypothetical protein